MKKKREISSKELRRIYDKWLGNFCYGVTEILNLDSETQMYLWIIVMNGTFYNQTTNPILSKMYLREDLQNENDEGVMPDWQLSPINKNRLFGAMEKLITNSCRKKFTDTLRDIKKSYQQGEY